LSSPSVLPLSPFDLELLVVRAISMSLLPTALLA
jgi:hypothetical protein